MKRLEECAKWLMEAQSLQGSWTYQKPNGAADGSDNSNTQFALLGLRAAANVGVAIPASVWRRALDHWIGTQLQDGGWTYVKSDDPKANWTGSCSMSAAGLCCTGEWLDITDTCFALLFLKRAFIPVATGGSDK